MRLQQLKRGRVKKVIHVQFEATDNGCKSSMESCDGYGILQDSQGQEIYFVDAALQNARLSDVRVGMEVDYLPEESPLQRAAKIWIVRTNPECVETTDVPASNRRRMSDR